MKIKESLVYDKNESKIIGFVNLGEVNDQLSKFDGEASNDTKQSNGEIATHILTIMVRGIFFRLRFPYAHFPTTGITGDFIFLIVWEAIERLERLGFKVLVITADGASANRKFFRMHHDGGKDSICYKTKNPYAKEERNVYFVSDVPHLKKTVRNCWSHSYGHGHTRKLWVSTTCTFLTPADACTPVCVCVHIMYSSVWYVNVCIIISMCMCEILIKDHVYSTLYSMHTLSCIYVLCHDQCIILLFIHACR